jgi:hypothetical protein
VKVEENLVLVSPDQRNIRKSLRLLWWAPLSLLVGFVAGSWLVDESWPLSQVVPLALIMAAPFAVGAYFGLRAVRRSERRGWVGLSLHLILMLVALVMPIVEAMTL